MGKYRRSVSLFHTDSFDDGLIVMQRSADYSGALPESLGPQLRNDLATTFTVGDSVRLAREAGSQSCGSDDARYASSLSLPALRLRQLSEQSLVGMSHERMDQFERLELVHTMSAGIAHDFKNIMQVIESYAAVLQAETKPGASAYEIAQEILSAAARGSMLTNRWLAYSRYGMLKKQNVNFVEFVGRCMEQVGRELPKFIHVDMRTCREELYCELDACLMEQAFFNICLNARDAMPRGGGLHIDVERVEVAHQSPIVKLVPPGVYGKLSIADEGAGIAADLLARIFDPFFSTKADSDGTGLGLALVRSIVAEHQGAIEVHSGVGVGSKFTIYVPAS